jgi:hypothetical protein
MGAARRSVRSADGTGTEDREGCAVEPWLFIMERYGEFGYQTNIFRWIRFKSIRKLQDISICHKNDILNSQVDGFEKLRDVGWNSKISRLNVPRTSIATRQSRGFDIASRCLPEREPPNVMENGNWNEVKKI